MLEKKEKKRDILRLFLGGTGTGSTKSLARTALNRRRILTKSFLRVCLLGMEITSESESLIGRMKGSIHWCQFTSDSPEV